LTHHPDRSVAALPHSDGQGAGTWFRTSLRTSILWWFLGISLLPLVALSIFGYQTAVRSRDRDISARLESVAEIKRRSLQEFFASCARDLDHHRRLDSTLALFADDPAAGEDLRRFFVNSPYHDILAIDTQGQVRFTCQEDGRTGRNLLHGETGGSHLASTCLTALDSGRPAFATFQTEPGAEAGKTAFLVHPVTGRQGDTLGLLVFQLTTEWLTHLLYKDELLGRNGQVYLVDADYSLLTLPPRHPWLQTLPDPLGDQVSSPWQRSLEPGQDGYAGMRLVLPTAEERQVRYLGPSGESISGLKRDVVIYGQAVHVVAEVNRALFLAGLQRMKLAVSAMLLLVTLLVGLFGQVVSARIVRPLDSLGQAMDRVADGHDVRDLPTAGPREVGKLAGQFQVMVGKLNEAKAVNDRQLHLKRCQFELHECMSGEPEPAALAQSVLDYLAAFYGAQVGVLYLARAGQRLGLAASLGLGETHEVPATLRFGEGLIGAAAVQKKVQVLRDMSPDYFKVQTGLGETHPRCLVVAPFKLVGQVKGVLALGLLENLAPKDLEFLRLVSEGVATALDSARSRLRVGRLLDETRRQATVLSSQQKELRDSNRRLARGDRYKSEFLANMSHELRTPLNGMMIMSRVLADNETGNLTGAQVEAAETINQAGDDLLIIINDILDLSKVEAGKMDLHFEPVSLTGLTGNLQDLFAPVAEQAGLDFQVHLGPDLPQEAVTDPVRLSQVLKNLLNNAIKFTPRGKVVMRLRRPSPTEVAERERNAAREWVVISVADTGIGMSEEVQARVFEAFNQGDGSIGRHYGGSGLGLSISSGLTSLLGGTLWADSAEGRGSTFSLLLPVSPEAPPVPKALPAPQAERVVPDPVEKPDLSDRHVLVCDNDMRTVYALTGLFNDLGARVTVTRTWQEGRQVLTERPDISLVLADPALAPAEADDDLTPWHDLGGQTRRVIALNESGRSGADHGADAHLEKPLSEETLLEVLANLTDPATAEVPS